MTPPRLLSSLTRHGMNVPLPVLPDDLTSLRYEDFVALGRCVESSRNWLLGDLACGVEVKWGDGSLRQYASDIGVEHKTLEQFRTVSKAYKSEERSSDCTWSLHKVLASQDDRLELLASGDYPTVAKAREYVASLKPSKPAEPISGPENPSPSPFTPEDSQASEDGSAGRVEGVLDGEVVGDLSDFPLASPEDYKSQGPSVAAVNTEFARAANCLLRAAESDPVHTFQVDFFMKTVKELASKGWFVSE